jgi:hypothetical protein
LTGLGREGLPLAPLVDALRTLARTMPPGALADVLGPAAPALSRLLPELAHVMADAPAGSAGRAPLAPPAALAPLTGEDMSKAQLLEHVLGTFDRLSGVQPVLVVVEDLHCPGSAGTRWPLSSTRYWGRPRPRP